MTTSHTSSYEHAAGAGPWSQAARRGAARRGAAPPAAVAHPKLALDDIARERFARPVGRVPGARHAAAQDEGHGVCLSSGADTAQGKQDLVGIHAAIEPSRSARGAVGVSLRKAVSCYTKRDLLKKREEAH